MWEASTSDIPDGYKYRIFSDDTVLSFRQFFELLRSNDDFANWYSDTLAEFNAVAFYWELPPLTNAAIENDLEFVLIDAPMLARLPPEPAPFASLFEQHSGEGVIVFPNLGGDALLVAPCPDGPIDAYSHLAAFLRQGEQDQVRKFWQVAAQTLLDQLNDTPIWLSTAGGGVAWLHLRLDSRPKYYSYRRYAEMG
jgi:hypothetical protein